MIRIDLRNEFPEADLDPYHIETNIKDAAEKLATVPRQFSDAEVTNPDVAKWVRAIAAQAVADAKAFNPRVRKGPSLILRGSTGTGKTHQTYGAIRSLWLSGVYCKWAVTTAADLFAELRPSGQGERAFGHYATVPLLCLDDLGAHQITEWSTDTLFRLVNARYEARKPLIVTTNLPMVSRDRDAVTLAGRLGDRIASRLAEMARNHQVALKGEDRRRGGRGLTSR